MPRTTHDPRLGQASPLPPIDLNPREEAVLDFPDREFGELTPDDYAQLGFLCGVEVHQQLLTETKLFCRCPAGMRGTQIDAEVLRHMRPTLSELGKYDGCALMEFKTRKNIIYQLSRPCVCTYEMDDTPPFEINEDAVRTALEISRMFGLNLVSELHVMRKQYLDGSIPTGFQRTAMVGLGGSIPFPNSELGPRELRLRQLSLEEDSCREVSDIGHEITFRTDRLGTPLIETVTEPDLLTPIDAARGVQLLARVVRTSGKVRRGAGAARQDVNVSIAGSRRVEIKGVSSWRVIPRLVHGEAYRHLNLLRIRDELRRRGIREEHLSISLDGVPWESSDLVLDATTLLRRSDFTPIEQAVAAGHVVGAVKLPGFAGLLGHRSQPDIPFVREIEDRVRVIACLTARPFMIGSNVEGFGPAPSAWRQVRAGLRASKEDALILIWGPEQDVATAARETLARAAEAIVGVPSETRQAFADGTTGFERILPGPERMYPDTDTPPLPIPDKWIEQIEFGRREPPWDRERRYTQLGLRPAAASRLADAPWADLFDAVAPNDGRTCARLAHAMERVFSRSRRHARTPLPPADRVTPLVQAIEAGEMHPDGCARALERLVLHPEREASEILAEHKSLTRADDLDEAIAEAVELHAVLRITSPKAAERWAMGRVMGRFERGQVDPRQLLARLREQLGFVQ